MSDINKNFGLSKAGALGVAFGAVAAIAATPPIGLFAGVMTAYFCVAAKAMHLGVSGLIAPENSREEAVNDFTPK